MIARALVATSVLAATACAHVVRVESEPAGASVRVDGVPIGTTPAQFAEPPFAPPHEWDIEVSKAGYHVARVRMMPREPDPIVTPLLLVTSTSLCGTACCASGVLAPTVLLAATSVEECAACAALSGGATSTALVPLWCSTLELRLPDRVEVTLEALPGGPRLDERSEDAADGGVPPVAW